MTRDHTHSHEHEHDHEQLLAAAQRAVEQAPQDAAAHVALAEAYTEAGETEKALEAYRRAAELDPRSQAALEGIAYTLLALERLAEAVEAFDQALENDPGAASAHHGLGYAHARLGESPRAEAEYRKAIELGPAPAVSHMRLGELHATQGRAAEAEKEFQRAAELAPEDPEVLGGVAAGYHLIGKYSLAIKFYRRVLNFNDSGYVHGGLAGAYRRSGDNKRALKHLSEAYARVSPDDHFALACLASIGGRPDEAFDHLGRLLAAHPHDRYHLRSTAVFEFVRDDPRWKDITGE